MAEGAPVEMTIRLSLPRVELVASYLDLLEEIEANDGHVHPARPAPGEAPDGFVARLRAWEDEAPFDGDRVPQTTYWATVDTRVVGHIGLRRRLNDELASYGGHIGYTVRPSCRGRGIAKEMLRLVLETPAARATGRLLLTCAPDNVASIRTIEANGGVFERTVFVERIARATSLYWIELDESATARS
ncbi:MAG: GNAT family N-acetyltransferase [Deltaproteobacteria bacterium]|nr:GNAT family N-acetyltransferase [Deltaproteobacteria bacterium]